MNLPENVFENPYKAGQYLQFTMDVQTIVPHLIATLAFYQTFVISEDLAMTNHELALKELIYEETALAEFFAIHDVLACYFGQYGDLDIEAVWLDYVKDFTEQITDADVQDAGQVIFKSFCFRAYKEESVRSEWSDAEII
ncbi:hypothetical protein AU074_13955 [Pseudomonas sp. ATCC PTA-122608]|uniref:hypothetical protein n=1 Tax=Pseudomonas sp. ATCC PTA-122608 TaxID=1771311 RepID=UPI00096B8DCD|nr:hypothetical protein [Pseudomonas sp. ATCC PTA-122608]OLY72275.1 hypothetical protein AU074_13955 [Pseudomonas sp. ATCC PTA-122608]